MRNILSTASSSIIILFLILGCENNPTSPEEDVEKEEMILTTSEVIFFSSDRDGNATNIYMMDTAGQLIKQITKYDWGEYAATAISPDSNQLLFYQSAPGLDINVGMDIYIYKIKEDTIIGPISQGHPGNFSPDGGKFVFSRHTFTMDGGYESVYLYDLKNKTEIKLTEEGKTSYHPQISPDGNYICYQSSRLLDTLSYWALHLMDIHGNYIKNLTPPNTGYYASDPVFTLDGKSIIFWYNEKTWCYDICKLDLSNNSINYLTDNRFNGRYDITSNYMKPSVSNDGKKIYFYSHFNDYQYQHPIEIYSINIDGSGLARITNNNFWDSHPISGIVSYYIKK